MQPSSQRTATLITIGLLTATAQGATFVFDGGGTGWNDPESWTITSGSDGDGVPDCDDAVIIPTGFGVQLCGCVGSLTVQGTGQVTILDCTLEVSGSAGGSSFAAANALKLDGATATLYLSGSQTWSGTGSIQMDDTGALINIASGATITFSLPLHGFGSVSAASGTATLVNGSEVTADSASGALELASDLNLGGSGAWKAAGGELQFKRAHAGNSALAGNVFSTGGGNLHLFQSVTFTNSSACGSGGSQWTWSGSGGAPSYLTIEPNKTFTYKCFSSNCSNPGSGSSPFSVTAGGSQYSASCSS